MRQLHAKAFDPLMVSIGPFHHGKENLQSMEKRKIAYLDAFLTRTNISLETCINAIKDWENRIRACYAETIEFSSDDFVKMILVDSCFVIEVMWRFNYVNHLEAVSDQLSHRKLLVDSKFDMILLENQLPFFVLEGLFHLAFPNSKGTNECFINICIKYFKSLLLSRDFNQAMKNINQQPPSEIKHLLDLIRKCQAPSIPRECPKDFRIEITMRKATELEEAGMAIKPCRNSTSAATDICHTSGTLEIPKLRINTSTEHVLRNIIALESWLYYHDSYISHYIHFMDNLIDSSKEVEVLIRNVVIDSFSSDSHEVAKLFNNLQPNCLLPTYFYYGIQQQINAYCKVPRHRWRAPLRRDYCSSPWMIASTAAAMIFLLLTVIQAVCSIISVA